MKRTRLVIVIGFVLSGSFAFAQDEKIELGVFAGGYFNSGFQSFKVLNPITGAQVGTFKPVSEANSGIFGARGSYQFRPQMAAEATFGFSHRWPHPKSFCVRSRAGFCGDSTANTYRASLAGIADGNVYLYSGTLLTYLNQRGTWRPFFTVGAGGITRTSKIAFLQNLPPILVGVTTTPIFSPTLVPATTRTEMALVLGIGFNSLNVPHHLPVEQRWTSPPPLAADANAVETRKCDPRFGC